MAPDLPIMSNESGPKPPSEHILEQMEAIRPLAKILGFFKPEIREQFQEVEKQLQNVKQLMANRDLFAKTYSPLGWVNYDRLSTTIVGRTLEVSAEEGESLLTEYHLDPDNLRFLGYRFNTPQYEPWQELYERAVERTAVGDYLSAIPLVLIVIDGICTTSTGKHPFSGGADAPVFDSQTSGPGGLPEGLALLGSTRRKLDSQPIPTPFRHGIVHGLNPNFGSQIVAAKAFNLLQAMVDYFDRRRDEAQRLESAAEEQKPIDLRELGQSLVRNQQTKKAIDEWRPRPARKEASLAASDEAVKLPEGSPELFAAEYLSLLVARNFGGLAKATVDFPKRAVSYRAGRLREDLKEIVIDRWEITGVEDTSPAMSRVMTRLEGKTQGRSWKADQPMRLMFADENYDVVVRGLAGGAWTVMPDFATDLWLLAMRASREGGS